MKCPRKGQARVLLGVVLDPQDYRRCKATETAPLLLPLASVSRAQHPVSSSREEEHLTAFIVAPAESLFAAPRGPRTLTNAAGAAGRRGHTSPGVGWGAACPDSALSGADSLGGSFGPRRSAATASSGSPGDCVRQPQSGQSRRPAARQPATASGSWPAGAGYAGRAARWMSATGAPWWRGAVATAGGRAQGSASRRPRACAHPAPTKKV